MIELRLHITLGLQGPVLSATSEAGTFGLDAVCARDIKGNLVLPGSQIKGCLRQSFSELELLDEKVRKEWFGPDCKDNAENAPERGSLVVHDFVGPRITSDDSSVITRTAIEHDTGSVKNGAMQSIEAPFAFGETAAFYGEVVIYCKDEATTESAQQNILKGLRWIPALGGNKNIGFGRLVKVFVGKKCVQVPPCIESVADRIPESFRFDIHPCQPFCLAMPRTDANLFVSHEAIAGSVIKGCVANLLNLFKAQPLDKEVNGQEGNDWGALRANLHNIRFDFAFPQKIGQPPSPVPVLPLTLVRADDKTADVALFEKPACIDGVAPCFNVDWKGADWQAVEKEWDIVHPPRVLRTFTAIDAEKRRTKDEHLFGYEMIHPDGYYWSSRADLSRVDEKFRGRVYAELKALLSFGLRFLGKTKAEAFVDIHDDCQPLKVATRADNLWIVTLQSPALMLEPCEELNMALVDEGQLKSVYESYWKELCPEVTLVNFFAKQELLGGYLHYRFQNGKPYNPFLVTSPGSVFVLKGGDHEVFASWQRKGLPLPRWVAEKYGSFQNDNPEITWRNCPFVPENGFGQIAINMPCHAECTEEESR